MLPKYRIGLSIILTMMLAAALLGVGGFEQSLGGAVGLSPEQTAPQSIGVVQVYRDGAWMGGFTSSILEHLPTLQFDTANSVSGAPQISGWSLRDALLLLVSARQLKAETRLIVSSQRQKQSLILTWGQMEETPNSVLLRKRADGELDVFANPLVLSYTEQQILWVDRIELMTP